MEKQRQKLIVSADDFGIDPKANAAILALLEKGKIDRVGVLVNGNFSAAEIERLKNSGAKLDLHLDFPRPPKYKHRMNESVLGRSLNFLFCYFFGKFKTPFAEMEWEKQILKFKKIFSQMPAGLNSHQHIHFFPPYFSSMTKLADKYSISFFRFGREGLTKSTSSVYRILSRLRNKNISAFAKTRLETSDFLVSLDWIDNLEEFIDYLPEGQTEIVCHPERPKEYAAILKYF